jgi:RimJ/RimL family protein N-acetyltransferase
MQKDIALRLANIKDFYILLTWRNDIETRKVSHNILKVTLEEHLSWLTEILQNNDRKLYIAEENTVPVGTVRTDFSNNEYKLSWAIAPNYRNRGIAKKMVSLLANKIVEPIVAEIKNTNLGSVKVAEYIQMKLQKEVNSVLYYRRDKLSNIA